MLKTLNEMNSSDFFPAIISLDIRMPMEVIWCEQDHTTNNNYL